MIVASGTRDARVFLRLKISRQIKTKIKHTTESMTASSFATADPTSCHHTHNPFNTTKWMPRTRTYLQASRQRLPLTIYPPDCLTHLLLGNIAIAIFVEEGKRRTL